MGPPKNKRRRAIFLIALLVAGIVLFSVLKRHDPRSAAVPPSRVVFHNGASIVVLDPEVQARNGIRIRTLAVMAYKLQAKAYGIVFDLQPLLDLRLQVIAAHDNLERARASEWASQKEYSRLKRLSIQGGNVSQKKLESEEALFQNDQARLDGAQETFSHLQHVARIEWGDILGDWASGGNQRELDPLMEAREVLLLVTMPPHASIGKPSPRITVQFRSAGAERAARLVSASPRTDRVVQGATYFYRMSARNARIGMRLSVIVPLAGNAIQGVFLPDSSVVWQGGRPWMYVAVDARHFRREGLSDPHRMSAGWFTSGFNIPPQVVVEGAQLLLSQERQPELQLPSENSAKDFEEDDDDD